MVNEGGEKSNMNNSRRKKLKEAMSYLDMAFDLVDGARDGEQECLDNMPENLEYSERYEKMENAVDKLEDAISSIEDARDALGEAVQ